MRVEILGVRGSAASPGEPFLRYGGNTSCVVLATDAQSAPSLVLDAGTGLRSLTARLAGQPYRGTILLSHLHWDHVQGIPFFAAGDRDDARVDLFLPAQGGRSARELLAQQMSPPAFPITPDGLLGDWRFHAVEPGAFASDGFEVAAASVQHKGGTTLGYRVSRGGASLGYLPDHAPKVGVSAQLRELLHGIDVLIHDAQFLDHERPRAESYGHATVQDAIILADEVGAGRLVLFHHGPARTDDALDAIAAQFCEPSGGRVIMAAEGMTLDL